MFLPSIGAHEDQDGVQLPPQPAPPQASQAQTSPHDQARVSLKTPIQGRPPPAPTQASQAQSVSPQTSQPQPAPPQPSQTQPSPQVSHIVQPAHPNPIQSAPGMVFSMVYIATQGSPQENLRHSGWVWSGRNL